MQNIVPILPRVIKSMKFDIQLAYTLPMILEGVATSINSRFCFKEILVFDQNQDLGDLWYVFSQSYITTKQPHKMP